LERLTEFVKFLKENFNCLISMTSNGSKKIEWWKNNARYFDRIHMSCHREYVDIEQYRDLCDYLYDQKVVVSVSVMMDPTAWDQCVGMVEYLKRSRRKWTIRYVELIGKTIDYTADQKKLLSKHRARRVSLWFFWRNNKYYRSIVTAKDNTGKKYRLEENEILLKRLNNFYGWECSLGINWVHISMAGDITGTCNQFLYGNDFHYNLYDLDFDKKFNPIVQSVICAKTSCVCNIETNMPKKKINNTNKVIPIYEN